MIHENFLCEFYFIRHGESESNAIPGLVTGVDFDSPLSEKGGAQARLLGQRLRDEGVLLDRVYSSSLVRAVQTTEAILEAMGQPGRSFNRVDALIEQQIPGWRGVRQEDAYTPQMVAYMRSKSAHFVPPEGESFRMVQRRVSNWLDDEIIYNKDLVAKERSLTVAIIGHGAATKSLFQHIMGFDEGLIRRLSIYNCSISRLLFNKEGWSVICINDSSHLVRGGLGGTS